MDNEVVRLYSEGSSSYQISSQTGININKIWKILKASGIKIRSKKEALQKYAKYDFCVICGNSFRVRPNWDAGNHYRKTCSPVCEKKYRSIRVKETYTDERKKHMSEVLKNRVITWNIPKGSECSNWKGGATSSVYRRIAFEEIGLKKVCSNCGTEENLTIHHKDRNRTNNTQGNLMVLCKPCHTIHHVNCGDVGWSVHNKKFIPRINLDEILSGLELGKSIRALCREYHTSDETIDRILSENNIVNPRKRNEPLPLLAISSH